MIDHAMVQALVCAKARFNYLRYNLFVKLCIYFLPVNKWIKINISWQVFDVKLRFKKRKFFSITIKLN